MLFTAVTVAVLGCPLNTAISPKKSPSLKLCTFTVFPLPWCTTRDLGPQLSCTRGYEVPHEHFQTHSAEVCEEGLSREELA